MPDMDCRTRPTPELPLHAAVRAADRLGELDPVLAIGLARALVGGTFAALLEIDGAMAHRVADAADLLEDALLALADSTG